MLQFNTYHSVYSNKKLVPHRWADWSHISKQEDLKSVIPLFESCKLTQFYGFQQRYDENIIREFYATLYIPEDKMKLFWMFRGFKFSCNANRASWFVLRRKSKELNVLGLIVKNQKERRENGAK